MKIGVLGSGTVGQTLAGKLSAMGHEVRVGTRDPKKTAARKEKDGRGAPGFGEWLEKNPKVKLGTFAEAAAHGALLINALAGTSVLDVAKSVGAAAFAGKVVVDVANPLDFSNGMPPSLSVCNTDSLGEQLQRALPQARVVKTLNTVNASVMVDPRSLAGGAHTLFVAGDDGGAKGEVTALLKEMGWSDILDLGDIKMARGSEMYLALWVRLWGALKTPAFSIKVVR